MKHTLFSLWLCLLASLRLGANTLNYQVAVDTCAWGDLDLELRFTTAVANPVVALPSWMPGAWQLADYARHLNELTVTDASGTELVLEQLANNRWEIHCPPGETVTLRYRYHSSARGFMGRKLNSAGGTLFGASTFIFPEQVLAEQTLAQSVEVQLLLPSGWEVHTGLSPVAGSHPPRFRAADYHRLVDSPFQLGTGDVREFKAGGKPITLVLPVEGDFERDTYCEMVAALVEREIAFFGGAPFTRFLFFIHYTRGNSGGGGLEHRNSTTIGLPLARLQSDPRLTLPILAHELFHAWNMKHFFPRGFGAFDYQEPLRTTALWLGEGVTEYYGWLLSVRTGFITPAEFYDKIASEIATLEATPARDTMSVAEASRTVWEQGYASGAVSFYNKGFLLALMLDCAIRSGTADRRSLDDAMRELNRRFGGAAGYTDADLIRHFSEARGHDLSGWFEHYVTGTEPLDYAVVLRKLGLRLALERRPVGWIGDLTLFGPEHRFYMVGPQTPLGRAGIARGDALLSIDDWRVTDVAAAADRIAALAPGSEVELTLERGGRQLQLSLPVLRRDEVTAQVDTDPVATSAQKERRRQWLSGE